jgi:peroxiredoxin family protein
MPTKVTADAEMEKRVREAVDAYLAEKAQKEAERPKKIALISSKGTLDMAYPPLILATTAAALGWEAGIFFTFYGLNIIHKKKHAKLQIAPLGNPGMTALGSTIMKSMFKSHGIATIDDLLEAAVDGGVRLLPCAMTMDVFGYKATDFLAGAEAPCGAATFLDWAADADISLFI